MHVRAQIGKAVQAGFEKCGFLPLKSSIVETSAGRLVVAVEPSAGRLTDPPNLNAVVAGSATTSCCEPTCACEIPEIRLGGPKPMV